MSPKLRKLLGFLDNHFEEAIGVVMFFFVIAFVMTQVITRYFIKGLSFPWTEEVARYLYIFMIFFCSSIGVRENSHLKIDLFHNFLSEKGKKIHNIIIHLVTIGFFIYLFPYANKLFAADLKLGKKLPTSGLPFAWFKFCLPVFCILMLLRTIQMLVRECRKLKNPEEVEKK